MQAVEPSTRGVKIAARLAAARRVCFFAHHDIDDVVDPYVLHYLRALADAGFTIVLATTSRLPPAEVAKLSELCADVLLRENVGLDFGGWADCLARYPDLSAEFLLLCNDSVYGPFWSLSEFIDTLTAEPADFYGAISSLGQQGRPTHLQSWFLLLRPSAYDSTVFRNMLRDVPADLTKDQIISTYEYGLTAKLEGSGLTYTAAFDVRRNGRLLAYKYINPAFVLWRELLEWRLVPFVKVGVLRDRAIWLRGLKDWEILARTLDAHVTELTLSNLARRRRHYRPKPFEHARDLMAMPKLAGSSMPFIQPLFVNDMAASGNPRPVVPRLVKYHALNIAYRVVTLPYVLGYSTASFVRRRLLRLG